MPCPRRAEFGSTTRSKYTNERECEVVECFKILPFFGYFLIVFIKKLYQNLPSFNPILILLHTSFHTTLYSSNFHSKNLILVKNDFLFQPKNSKKIPKVTPKTQTQSHILHLLSSKVKVIGLFIALKIYTMVVYTTHIMSKTNLNSKTMYNFKTNLICISHPNSNRNWKMTSTHLTIYVILDLRSLLL